MGSNLETCPFRATIHSSGTVGTYFDLTSAILHPKELLLCGNWSKSQSEPSVSQACLHTTLSPAMSLEGAYTMAQPFVTVIYFQSTLGDEPHTSSVCAPLACGTDSKQAGPLDLLFIKRHVPNQGQKKKKKKWSSDQGGLTAGVEAGRAKADRALSAAILNPFIFPSMKPYVPQRLH